MLKYRGKSNLFRGIMKSKKAEHLRLDIIMLILTFGIQTLMEILLTVNSILSTNVLYMDTVFPDIAVTAVSVLEIAAMSVGFSIICAAFFMGKKKAPFLLIYAGAALYRRLLAAGITLLIGSLAIEDILMSVSIFVLDLAVLAFAAVIASIFATKYRRTSAAYGPSTLFTDKELKTDIDPIYPFKKLYGKGNLLQSSLLSIGILLSAVKVISRTVGLIIAAPDNILMTVGSYVGDILIVVISYAISCLLLSVLYGQNEKRKAMRILYGDN